MPLNLLSYCPISYFATISRLKRLPVLCKLYKSLIYIKAIPRSSLKIGEGVTDKESRYEIRVSASPEVILTSLFSQRLLD